MQENNQLTEPRHTTHDPRPTVLEPWLEGGAATTHHPAISGLKDTTLSPHLPCHANLPGETSKQYVAPYSVWQGR